VSGLRVVVEPSIVELPVHQLLRRHTALLECCCLRFLLLLLLLLQRARPHCRVRHVLPRNVARLWQIKRVGDLNLHSLRVVRRLRRSDEIRLSVRIQLNLHLGWVWIRDRVLVQVVVVPPVSGLRVVVEPSIVELPVHQLLLLHMMLPPPQAGSIERVRAFRRFEEIQRGVTKPVTALHSSRFHHLTHACPPLLPRLPIASKLLLVPVALLPRAPRLHKLVYKHPC